MSFPDMSDAFDGWQTPVTLKILTPTVVDFEVTDIPVERAPVRGVLQPLPPRKLSIKPEGERNWKWWTIWTRAVLKVKDVLIDPDGKQFRVVSETDFRNGGYQEFELVQEPT